MRSMAKERDAGRQVLDDRSNAPPIGTDFSAARTLSNPIHYVQFQSILIISRHDSHHFATALNYYPGEYKYTALAKYRSPFEHTESTHGIESRIIQKIQLQLEEFA